jgi:hypothetical protein
LRPSLELTRDFRKFQVLDLRDPPSLHTMLTGLKNCHDAQSCAAADGSSRSAAQK